MRNLELHHCIHGNKRKTADREGLTVHLCRTCHHRLHSLGEHDRELKVIAQEAWMKKHHEGVEAFRRLFGKSYI
jgi:hypothetical protein